MDDAKFVIIVSSIDGLPRIIHTEISESNFNISHLDGGAKVVRVCIIRCCIALINDNRIRSRSTHLTEGK